MLNINFGNSAVDLYGLTMFATQKRLDVFQVIHTAYMQRALAADEKVLLSKFINFLGRNYSHSNAQIFQDAFASCVVANRYPNKFLEFGATDGVDLSNSKMLEDKFGWTGVLAEPSPQWHAALNKNRPNTKIVTDCVWSKSGEKLDFFVSDRGELSTIEQFRHSDESSMGANTQQRNRSGKTVSVSTISLNDLIESEFPETPPSYISVDTEGSELDILKAFDFKIFAPVVLTVEHNHTKAEQRIDKLLAKNGYQRVFRKITTFDAWYVREDALEAIS